MKLTYLKARLSRRSTRLSWSRWPALLESSPDLDSGCVIVLKSSISEDGFAILDHFYLKPCFVNTARINFRFFLNEEHMSRLLGRRRAGPSLVPRPRRVLLREAAQPLLAQLVIVLISSISEKCLICCCHLMTL